MSDERPEDISPALLQAYRSTLYRVNEPGLIIRVDQINLDLETWLEQIDANCWAFITAYNPWSRELSDAENQARHQALLEACARYQIFSGVGEPCDQSWKAEASLMILNISLDEAMKLCQGFEQNAFVYGKKGQPAKLVFNPLRPSAKGIA